MANERVVIVGGGILGTMHAYFARRSGASVVHLERHSKPRGASVRNFGLIWVSGRARGAELAMALRARELWEQVGRDIPATGFRANGSITLVADETELNVIEAAAASADAAERGFSVLGADEVRFMNPGLHGEFLAGLCCPFDAAVEPRLVLGAIRDWLSASGRYEFLAPREVVDVADHEVIDSTGARYAADLVVLCVGAVSGAPLGVVMPGDKLQRVRLQMAETWPLSRGLTTSVADGNSLR
jgi:FAD dependent oxidoreductase TIGR03364